MLHFPTCEVEEHALKKKRINRKRALYIAGGITLIGLGLWWLSRRATPPALPAPPATAALPPPPVTVSGLDKEPTGGKDVDGLMLSDDYG